MNTHLNLVTALRKELETIIELAERGIASERLGGNVVKEEHWKGQRIAATQVIQWLESQPQNDQHHQPERKETNL